MTSIREIKRKIFPKGIKRKLSNNFDKLWRRVDLKTISKAVAALNIPSGSVVCIHSSLYGLGYIVGGPETVIQAIQKAVPNCTVIMPTFPFSGSMLDYIKSNPAPFSPQETPSRSGLLSETLWRMPGALRSMHPTHSCAAIGPLAALLLDGSENSITPFGPESAYGRFTHEKNAFLLLINTNGASIVHCIQEETDMPNLFLEKDPELKGFDQKGNIKDYTVKMHRPKIPLYVAVEGKDKKTPQFLWLPDYCFLFPSTNKQRILNGIKSKKIHQFLLQRDQKFQNGSIYTYSKIKQCEIMAVRVKPWMEVLCADVLDSINTFQDKYDLSYLKKYI